MPISPQEVIEMHQNEERIIDQELIDELVIGFDASIKEHIVRDIPKEAELRKQIHGHHQTYDRRWINKNEMQAIADLYKSHGWADVEITYTGNPYAPIVYYTLILTYPSKD